MLADILKRDAITGNLVTGSDGIPDVCQPGQCNGRHADYNVDGQVTVQDIFDFLTGWFAKCNGQAGTPCNGKTTDIDASGVVDVNDIFAFLNAWFAGCV